VRRGAVTTFSARGDIRRAGAMNGTAWGDIVVWGVLSWVLFHTDEAFTVLDQRLWVLFHTIEAFTVHSQRLLGGFSHEWVITTHSHLLLGGFSHEWGNNDT